MICTCIFQTLRSTWLATADRLGKVAKTALLQQVEAWINVHRPILIVIDSIAAVFDGEAIARRQVRSFLAMLRKIARENEAAIVLLDHPSVRGMADGSGTANSVDWRNSVRAMLHLSDADKNDPDIRELEVKKSNYGRAGEKVKLRWNGLTFVSANVDGEFSIPGGGRARCRRSFPQTARQADRTGPTYPPEHRPRKCAI
jgi:RecA-family ATPase